MDLYVQSRGFAQDCDYRWLQIDEDNSARLQLPPIGLELSNLIDNETPSVALERLPDERLLLLVTGIEPEGRVDFLDRPIRIAVAWVGCSSDELALRRLAARALLEQNDTPLKPSPQKSLLAQINNAVPLDGEYGFEVSRQSMLELVALDSSQELPLSKAPNLTKKIGCNSPKLRNELAEELKDYCLPTQTGPLIVVTGIKKRESLEEALVWRSLSSLMDTNDWSELPVKPEFSLANLWEGKDPKNPLMWFMVLRTLVSYWLEFLWEIILANKKATSGKSQSSDSQNRDKG
ncbi:MAG TPA: hypothetical protein DDZ80_24175 [Cyanobacteria bacterium UBA8803]|nr:hypothetical protein [Cyanobacteria bacterium UBA9273]HBL61410.1 hypothetical protein [Cyanobacteria bacterium UBA8803]